MFKAVSLVLVAFLSVNNLLSSIALPTLGVNHQYSDSQNLLNEMEIKVISDSYGKTINNFKDSLNKYTDYLNHPNSISKLYKFNAMSFDSKTSRFDEKISGLKSLFKNIHKYNLDSEIENKWLIQTVGLMNDFNDLKRKYLYQIIQSKSKDLSNKNKNKLFPLNSNLLKEFESLKQELVEIDRQPRFTVDGVKQELLIPSRLNRFITNVKTPFQNVTVNTNLIKKVKNVFTNVKTPYQNVTVNTNLIKKVKKVFTIPKIFRKVVGQNVEIQTEPLPEVVVVPATSPLVDETIVEPEIQPFPEVVVVPATTDDETSEEYKTLNGEDEDQVEDFVEEVGTSSDVSDEPENPEEMKKVNQSNVEEIEPVEQEKSSTGSLSALPDSATPSLFRLSKGTQTTHESFSEGSQTTKPIQLTMYQKLWNRVFGRGNQQVS